MTLIVALEGKDGLTLASDSRGTFGDPRGITAQNDSMQKLYKLSDYTGILISGSGELGVSLIDEVIKAIKAKSLIGVTPLAQEFSSIAKAKYAEWFTNFAFPNVQNADKPVRPTISVIIGGYDVDEQGKPIESEKKYFNQTANMILL